MRSSCKILDRSVVYLGFRRKQLSLSLTGFGNHSTGTFVERMLEVLQTRAPGQCGQARRLQGPSLGSLPHDGGSECLHVAAVQLFSLLRIERLGLVLIMVIRQDVTSPLPSLR